MWWARWHIHERTYEGLRDRDSFKPNALSFGHRFHGRALCPLRHLHGSWDILSVEFSVGAIGVVQRLATHVVCVILSSVPFIPLLVAANSALVPTAKLYAGATVFVSTPPTLAHLRNVVCEGNILLWMRNSLGLGLASGALSIVAALPAAYFTARSASRSLAFHIRVTSLFSYVLLPIFLAIGVMITLTNPIPVLLVQILLVYACLQMPIHIWFLEYAVLRVPVQQLEAASLEGAHDCQILIYVLLPQLRWPLAACILTGLWLAWCDYSIICLLRHSNDFHTVTTGLMTLRVGDVYRWGELMAASLVLTIASFALFSCVALVAKHAEEEEDVCS